MWCEEWFGILRNNWNVFILPTDWVVFVHFRAIRILDSEWIKLNKPNVREFGQRNYKTNAWLQRTQRNKANCKQRFNVASYFCMNQPSTQSRSKVSHSTSGHKKEHNKPKYKNLQNKIQLIFRCKDVGKYFVGFLFLVWIVVFFGDWLQFI